MKSSGATSNEATRYGYIQFSINVMFVYSLKLKFIYYCMFHAIWYFRFDFIMIGIIVRAAQQERVCKYRAGGVWIGNFILYCGMIATLQD